MKNSKMEKLRSQVFDILERLEAEGTWTTDQLIFISDCLHSVADGHVAQMDQEDFYIILKGDQILFYDTRKDFKKLKDEKNAWKEKAEVYKDMYEQTLEDLDRQEKTEIRKNFYYKQTIENLYKQIDSKQKQDDLTIETLLKAIF